MMNRLFILLAALVIISTTVRAQEPSNILSPEQKVFGLSKFWQEVNYNFVYLDRVDRTAWDRAYLELIAEVQKTKNDYEYYRLLQRFCAMLDDGHTSINYPFVSAEGMVFIPERNSLFSQRQITIEEIEGEIFVTRISKNLAETLPVKSRIVEVNGLPVEEYIEKFTLPYVCQSTDHVRRYESVFNIAKGIYGEKKTFGILKPDGTQAQVEITLGGQNFDSPEGYDGTSLFQMPDKPVELRWYDDVAYVALNNFMNDQVDDEFRKIVPDIRRARGLILDLRLNVGGNSNIGAQILEYLTPDSILRQAHSRTRQNIAVHRAWGGNEDYMDLGTNVWRVEVPMDERIVVPTVVLMSNFTASAAEDFLIMADGQEHFTTIGQRSFGSTGQPLYVQLVGGISAQICTKDDTYPDGRVFVGVGVIPDVETATPTIEELEAGKDPVLEKALELF